MPLLVLLPVVNRIQRYVGLMWPTRLRHIAEREGLGEGRAQNGWLAVELLRFSNLECHYGAREVFSSVSGAFNDGERVRMLDGAPAVGLMTMSPTPKKLWQRLLL